MTQEEIICFNIFFSYSQGNGCLANEAFNPVWRNKHKLKVLFLGKLVTLSFLLHFLFIAFLYFGGQEKGRIYHTCDNQVSLQESVFSFHLVGPRGSMHVIRVGSKYLYPWSHLADPQYLSHPLGFEIPFKVGCQSVIFSSFA